MLLRSLLLRFMIVAVPLLLVFVLFNFFFITDREQGALADELRKRAVSIARNLALNGAQAREAFGDYLLPPLARAAARLPDVAWVAFTDEKGHVLAEAGADAASAQAAGALQEAALHGREAVERVTLPSGPCIAVCQPMISRLGALGTVQLGIRTTSLQAAATAARNDVLVLTVLLACGTVLVTLPLVYVIVSPVRRILRTARAIANGDLEARVQLRRRDELGRLGVALNRMAERLSELVERERSKRAALEQRVAELRACSRQVADGRLEVRAAVAEDELGQLAAGFNAMVEHIQALLERERAMQKDVEANQAVLETANQRLMALDRKKSDFLNTVSHELRTPLTSIKAFSEILLEQAGDPDAPSPPTGSPDADREFLGIIDQEADRLTRLIEDLLDLSRIEEGQATHKVVRLPLDVVVENCTRSCRALAEQKNITLRSAGQPGLTVRGDRDRLAQVLTNLLSNAIKFTPAGGEVAVTTGTDEGFVTLAVADTGLGIPADDQVRIFEKFQQVDRGGERGPVGSGLGLPIVKSIVEAHGGRIAVESRLEQGSTFTVWLPSA